MAPTPVLPGGTRNNNAKLQDSLGSLQSLSLIQPRQNTPSTPTTVVIYTSIPPTATATIVYTPNPMGSPSDPGALIGGVIGGVLGLIIVIWVIWRGCWDPVLGRRRYMLDDLSSLSSSRSSRVRRRGGGGEDLRRYYARERRGGRVQRPRSVFLRDGRRSSGRRVSVASDAAWRDGLVGGGGGRRVVMTETKRWSGSGSEKRGDGKIRFNVGDD